MASLEQKAEDILRRHVYLKLQLAVGRESIHLYARGQGRAERLSLSRGDAVTELQGVTLFMKTLPPEERSFVRLRYFEGCTFSEIGSRAHSSLAALYRTRVRVLQKFVNSFGLAPDAGVATDGRDARGR